LLFPGISGLLSTASAQQAFSYTRLTVEDGLSNNSVQCVLQDKTGIMWIGTNGGLNRYDGSSFIQYNILSRPALTSGVITALLQDTGGRIWIGTENGLNILDPATNTVLPLVHDDNNAASLPPGPVRGIQKMKDGSIGILSDYWFARQLQHRGFVKTGIDPSLTGPVKVFTRLTEGDDGQWWISYLDHPTALAKKCTGADGCDSLAATGIPCPDYAQAYIDSTHTAWGISYTGVTRYNDKTHLYEPWLKNRYTKNILNLHVHTCYCPDAGGNIWQGAQGLNLVQYNLRQKQVIDYSHLLTAAGATMVNCLYRDNSNTLWAGTDNGLIKLSGRTAFLKRLPVFMNGKELKDIHCRKIIQDREGMLYAGTESHGLLKLAPSPAGGYLTTPLFTFGAFPVASLPVKDNVITVQPDGRYDIGFVYDMWSDNDHTLWLTGCGLGRYDTRSATLDLFLADGDAQTRAESVSQYSICFDGRLLWTGGQHNIFTFNPATRRMQVFRDNKGNMPFHDIPCWCLVKKGAWIWAGTDKGLYKINLLTREVQKEQTHPALGFGINAIHIDADSSFWISTAGGGILHYNTETTRLQQYTNKDGLANNTVCGILPDDKNNLWISTYAGLCYLDRQSNQFTSFYTKDGLNTDEFNRKAFTRLANGYLVFGGQNGYTCFNPADAFKTYKPVQLLLTRFSKTAGNGAITETVFGAQQLDKVVIDPGDKFFSFTYTLTDMFDPGSNRYLYTLEGLDNDWHYVGQQHTISFMSLPAGKYTLRIKGSPAKGRVADNEITIPIIVNQVFYRTAWFIVLALLAGSAVLYGIIQYRMGQLKKLQDLRTRIASDLHDEVGSNLVRITILADAGKRNRINENNYEQLGAIAGISRGAVSTMKDVIWSIDTRNDTMGGMLNHMHEHIHQMLVPADIDFSFVHTGLPENERLKMDFRQNIYLIFKEAINNIVKHAGASQVQMEVKRASGRFIMTIKDNGQGMVDKGRGSSQGLSNMKMRAARIKASLDIISQKEGVTIVLSV